MYDNIKIVEVGPRDGFQNVKSFIPTDKKVEIAKALIDVGFEEIEVTSFVSPKWIPQMADAADVVAELKKYRKENNLKTKFVALAGNPKGVDNAVLSQVDNISYPISISERHNKENVNRTRDQSFLDVKMLMEKYPDIDMTIGFATVFGSPYAGDQILIDDILKMSEKAFNLGAKRIVVSDTVGNGNPAFVDSVLTELKKHIDFENVNIHLHNTFDLALANTLIGLKHGIKVFESAAGGLGGCPFAPGAAGNISTEDVLNMFELMDIKTPYDKQKLFDCIALIEKYVDSPIMSHSYNFYKCNHAFKAEAK